MIKVIPPQEASLLSSTRNPIRALQKPADYQNENRRPEEPPVPVNKRGEVLNRPFGNRMPRLLRTCYPHPLLTRRSFVEASRVEQFRVPRLFPSETGYPP